MIFFSKDRPDVTVTPSKVFLLSLPAQVKFNCSVNSYPEGNIIWMKNYRDLKTLNKTSKRHTFLSTNNLVYEDPSLNDNHERSYHYTNKRLKGKSKKTRKNLNRHRTKWINRNARNKILSSENVLHSKEALLQNYVLNSLDKYVIRDYIINETHKLSTLFVNVDSEDDLGVYECFSNNTAGSKTEKFYVYAGLLHFIFCIALVHIIKNVICY